jgi:fibronectin-binding autotransporter adhesin
LSNTANDFAGGITISTGTFLRTDNSEVLPDTAVVTNNGNWKLSDTGTKTETIAGLTGGGLVFQSVGAPGNNILQVGAGDVSSTFNGLLGTAGQNNTFALVKIGAGTFTLNGANAYSNGTTINQGRIVMGTDTALGTGPVTLNGGAMERNAAGVTVANAISIGAGGGTIVGRTTVDNYTTFSGQVTGSGALTLQGLIAWSNTANTYNGAINLLNANTYFFASASEVIGDSASLNFNGSYFKILGGGTETIDVINGASGNIFANGAGATLRIGANNGNSSFAGTIYDGGGSFRLIKLGTGTAILAGANSYTGGTIVSNGVLQIGTGVGTSGVLPGNGTITSSGTLKFNYGATGVVYGGQLSGNGTVIVTGNNDLQLSGNNAAFTGTVLVDGSAAHLRMRNDNAISGASLVLTNGASVSTYSYVDSHNITVASLSSLDPTTWVRIQGGYGLVVGSNNQSTTFAGVIKNDVNAGGFVTKVGSGTLTLTGTNTFNGALSINGGAISASYLTGGNTPSSIGGFVGTSGNFLFNGGTLQYTGPTVTGINRAFTINAGGANIEVTQPGTTLQWSDASGAGPIIGTGGLTKSGPGILQLAGASSFTGDTRINGGTLQLANSSALAGSTLDYNNYGGTLSFTTLTAATFGGLKGAQDLPTSTVALTVGGNNQSTTYSGALAGTVSLTKNGNGNLRLTGANSYNGLTTVNAGTVTYTGGTRTTTGATQLDLYGAGTIVFTNETVAPAQYVTLHGGLNLYIQDGTTFTGFNNLHLGYNPGSGFTGTNTVYMQGGLLTMPQMVGIGEAEKGRLIQTGGTINVGTSGLLFSANGTAQGIYDLSGGTLISTNAGINMGLTSGTAGGIWNFTGGTALVNAITNSFGSPVINFGAGTLQPSTDLTTPASITINLTGTGGNATIDTDNHTVTIDSPVAGAGGLIKTGTGTLSLTAANNYSGDTTASAGTLLAGNADAFGASVVKLAGGALQIGGNYTLTNAVTLLQNGTVDTAGISATLSGTISGNNSLTKTGGGRLSLTAANTYTGDTIITGGTLLVNNSTGSATGSGTVTVNSGATLGGSGTISGDVFVDGTLAPGNSPGTLTVSNLTLTSSAYLTYELGATNASDLVVVTGNLTLDGTLNISMQPGFGVGQYTLFEYSGALTTNGTPAILQLGNGYDTGIYNHTIDITQAGLVLLDVSLVVVPEPETLALVGGSLLFLLVLRRRRS